MTLKSRLSLANRQSRENEVIARAIVSSTGALPQPIHGDFNRPSPSGGTYSGYNYSFEIQ